MQRFGKTLATGKGRKFSAPTIGKAVQNGDKSGDLPTHKQLSTFRGIKRCVL